MEPRRGGSYCFRGEYYQACVSLILMLICVLITLFFYINDV